MTCQMPERKIIVRDKIGENRDFRSEQEGDYIMDMDSDGQRNVIVDDVKHKQIDQGGHTTNEYKAEEALNLSGPTV